MESPDRNDSKMQCKEEYDNSTEQSRGIENLITDDGGYEENQWEGK